jgi:hypothetical protein
MNDKTIYQNKEASFMSTDKIKEIIANQKNMPVTDFKSLLLKELKERLPEVSEIASILAHEEFLVHITMKKKFTEVEVYCSKKMNGDVLRKLVLYEMDFISREISHSVELQQISEAIFSWEFENDNVIHICIELSKIRPFDEWPIKVGFPELKVSIFCHICGEKSEI